MQNKHLRIQNQFLIKILSQLQIEKIFLNRKKDIYPKTSTNITLHDEVLNAFFLRSQDLLAFTPAI